MASPEELQKVVGRLMLDPEFRTAFQADPQGAASKLGVQLTQEQVQTFQNNMDKFVEASQALEEGGVTADAMGHAIAVFSPE